MGATLYGFMNPVGLLVGNAFGANNTQAASSVIRHGLIMALIGGLVGMLIMLALLPLLPFMGQPADVLEIITPYWVLTALSLILFNVQLVYKQMFDSIDRAWTGVVLTLVPVALNIPLTGLLVNGGLGLPAMGITGAGVATLVAQVIGTLVMMIYVYTSQRTRPFVQRVAYTRGEFALFLRQGLPMGIQYLSEGGSVAFAGIMIGWVGATTLAANQIVFSVISLLYMLPLGMSSASGIRISQALGSESYERVRPIGLSGNAIVALWTSITTVALIIFGAGIAQLFTQDAAIVQVAAWMFVAVGFMQVFDGLQSVSLGSLRGIRDMRFPVVVSLVAYWLLALPAGYVLAFTFNLGGAGLWLGFGIGLAVAGITLVRRFNRLSQQRDLLIAANAAELKEA
jgi:multidrug resistance protein, MATE family